MKRGDLVIVSAPGDYGKPRPAVIVQSDAITANDSILVCLVTGTRIDASIYRLTIEPDGSNGLRLPSQIMIDKIVAMPRDKCGTVIGALDPTAMAELNSLLAVVIGLAD